MNRFEKEQTDSHNSFRILEESTQKNLLTKGYSILFHEKKDSVILSTQELKEQDKVRLQLHDGKVHLTVNGLET